MTESPPPSNSRTASPIPVSPEGHPFRTITGPPRVPRISPRELAERLRNPDPPVLVDVRTADERALGHLAGDRWIPLAEVPARAGDLPVGTPVVVYCHHGGRATQAASYLLRSGRSDVTVLDGGLDGYARDVDPTLPRYGDSPTEGLVLQQFPNLETGCLAYLLADAGSHEAVLIDPGKDVAPYLAAVRRRGLKLHAIVETHTHADHLSGHAELHQKTDAPIWLGHRSPASYPHERLAEGDSVRFGGLELGVLETPGHTPDHLSLRVDGFVFTGDTLLPGSCGRADLGAGDPDVLWESLTQKLLTLPDETEVLPAHYGPRQGLPPPERFSSTIGFERRTNEALVQPDLPAFRRYMTEGWPPAPAEFDRIVRANLDA